MSHLLALAPACFFSALIGLQLCPPAVSANAHTAQEWRYKVFLDDKPIGYHHFRMTDTDQGKQLNSKARFDVTLWKIPLFRYRHENVEHWNDSCLASIESTTNQNGERYKLSGADTDQGFRVVSNKGDTTLPE